MKSYRYSGYDQAGREARGIVSAPSFAAGQEEVLRRGIYLVSLEEARGSPAVAGASRVKQAELTMFMVQLAALLEAGLQLDRCLEVLHGQATRSRFGKVLGALVADVRAGTALSEAMAKHGTVFAELQTQMVRAGELSGHLETVLAKLAEYMEKEEARRSQIKSALVYPIMLICLAAGATGFIVSFVVPKMSQVFSDLGAKLPWSTRLLIGIGAFMAKAWPLVLGAVAALVLAVRVYAATEKGGRAMDGWVLRIPLVGPLALKMSLAKFARAMAVMGTGGVGIMEALEVAAGASGNRVVKQSVLKARPEVREGQTLAASLKAQGIFPEMMRNLVAVGEETGNVDRMLAKVAEVYDFEVDAGLRRLLSLLEPVLIIIMGCVVAFIVISILVPIFDLGAGL
ncbi:MAG: type II secretion system F family protein [Bacteroidota bacterium]